MRKLVAVLVVAVAALAALSPDSAVSSTPGRDFGTRHAGGAARFTVLQMNLCLSGQADCYARTAYPSIVDEATEQILDHDVDAATLNEACSGDAAELAHRTGYQVRFTAVLFRGRPLPCVMPAGRGVFGLAILTKDRITSSHDEAFAIHADAEERRWMCATTAHAVSVCTAHLGTRGSTAGRRANDAECHQLRGVLAGYDEAGATMFGGDVNRQQRCSPASMWARHDTAAAQTRGIQHIYGSASLDEPSARVAPATYTDHDYFLAASTPLWRSPG